MRDLARAELDRIDELAVGDGLLEAFAFGRGDLRSGMLGGAMEYGHRVTEGLSIFGRGELGYRYGHDRGLAWAAVLGGRLRF